VPSLLLRWRKGTIRCLPSLAPRTYLNGYTFTSELSFPTSIYHDVLQTVAMFINLLEKLGLEQQFVVLYNLILFLLAGSACIMWDIIPCCFIGLLLFTYKFWIVNQGIVKEFILLALVAGQNSAASCLI
jgi:hypothetical protein